jgi:probable rRNA maturation factor
MQLNIHNWSNFIKYFPDITYSKTSLENILEKIFSVYSVKTLNIVFATEKDIKNLNNEYRKKDESTDVLSFVIEESPLVGEVYICPEYISKNYGAEEVLRDIVHGFLHLMGEDHEVHFEENSAIKEEMFVKQENILQNIVYEINNRARKSRKGVSPNKT